MMGTQVSIKLEKVGPTTSEATMRTHSALVDRPEAKGGADKGPMGGELLLSGVGGCFMSNLLAAAIARDIEIGEVSVTVTGTIDGNPARFTAIELAIASDFEDPALLEKLTVIAERSCLSANTVKNAVDLSLRLI